jgi:hypothetical protein
VIDAPRTSRLRATLGFLLPTTGPVRLVSRHGGDPCDGQTAGRGSSGCASPTRTPSPRRALPTAFDILLADAGALG